MHEDLLSLQPQAGLSRREFVVTSLAAGFALNRNPIETRSFRSAAWGL